jgi:hypothetical protein
MSGPGVNLGGFGEIPDPLASGRARASESTTPAFSRVARAGGAGVRCDFEPVRDVY